MKKVFLFSVSFVAVLTGLFSQNKLTRTFMEIRQGQRYADLSR